MRSRDRWPGRRNGRHVNRPARRQALELLVGCPDGCAEGILFANGFKRELLLDLLQLGLAYAQAERMVIDAGRPGCGSPGRDGMRWQRPSHEPAQRLHPFRLGGCQTSTP